MIIHLIASMRKFEEDLSVLRKISDIIYEQGHRVDTNWFEGVATRTKHKSVIEESLDWPKIVQQNIKSIQKSDVLIIEGSRFNYSQGFQTAVALQHKKPILNLCRQDAPELAWPDKMFVSGVAANPIFISKFYKDESDLEEMITAFLDTFDASPENITIELKGDTQSFLNTQSRASGKTKADIIQEIITKEATKL